MTPTLVPILGSVIEGDFKPGTGAEVALVTSRGYVVRLAKEDIQTVHMVQPGQDASQSLYRAFVPADAQLAVRLSAASWAAAEAGLDAEMAALARSGARKKIEDTA